MRHESDVEIDFGYDVGEAAKDVTADVTCGGGIGNGVAFRIDVGYLGYGSFDRWEIKENASPSTSKVVEDREAKEDFRREGGREREGDVVKSGLEWNG